MIIEIMCQESMGAHEKKKFKKDRILPIHLKKCVGMMVIHWKKCIFAAQNRFKIC